MRYSSAITSVAALTAISVASPAFAAAVAVTITLNPSQAKSVSIPSDFVGLSFEQDTMRSDFNGGTVGWLDGRAGPFATMVKTLGVHSLRIGGNEGETGPYPTTLDGSHVNDFAAQVGANIIWAIPVGTNFNATTYANYAKFLIDNKNSKSQTFSTVFAVGNEPDMINISSGTYTSRFLSYLSSLKSTVGTDVLLGGSSIAGDVGYNTNLINDANVKASRANIGYVFFHRYPEGGANSYPTTQAAISKMLDKGNTSTYSSINSNYVAQFVSAGFKPRMEETNSMYGGGFVGVSNAFASSLWALDCIGYWTTTSIYGLNFHIGHSSGPGAGGAYNPIDPVGNASNYTLRGVGYAMLAYKQMGQGRSVPVSVTNPSGVNLTAYALVQGDGSESIMLVNKSYADSTPAGSDVSVTLDGGKLLQHAQIMFLTAPNSDPATLTGITLGGQGVSTAGIWTGNWTQTLTSTNGKFALMVPQTSAAIVRLY